MLWSIDELKVMYKFSQIETEVLERKMLAIETAIRNYTNNNFMLLDTSTQCNCNNGIVYADTNIFNVGDTVQVTKSNYNNGLYVIEDIDNGYITFDKPINNEYSITITKISYPADILEGAIELLDWSVNGQEKLFVSSESISRHSVSYRNFNDSEMVYGYPKMLMGFCNPYKKMRV